MIIDEQVIHKIETIFNFKLYDEQKTYLLNDNYYNWQSGRRSGKTFVYCIKLSLSEGEPLNMKHSDWFRNYFYDVWLHLKDSGFKVRDIRF